MKAKPKKICWDVFVPLMEDQFALVKSAELHRLNIVSETLQAQLLQLFFNLVEA